MALPSEIIQLERDFFSGRNPLAYIPLCQALRRRKEYVRALDVCQRGLAGDPDSLAGRRLLAQLLIELGHYEEALREIGRAEANAPDAAGLLVVKTNCLIRLGRFDEAEAALERLRSKNLMAPDVQMLSNLLREQRRDQRGGVRAPTGMEAPIRAYRKNNREILDSIREEMASLVKLQCVAVIPVGAGEPALEGNPLHGEAAYEFFRSTSTACRELESGGVKMGFLETPGVQLIVLVRKEAIVAVSFGPAQNFGKVLHRLTSIIGPLMRDTTPSGKGL